MPIRIYLIGLVILIGVVLAPMTSAQITHERSSDTNGPKSVSVTRSLRNSNAIKTVGTQIDHAAGNSAGVFVDTGADQCADVTVVPVPVGPEGNPSKVRACVRN